MGWGGTALGQCFIIHCLEARTSELGGVRTSCRPTPLISRPALVQLPRFPLPTIPKPPTGLPQSSTPFALFVQ